jgi:o-succinylbenzoate synthase
MKPIGNNEVLFDTIKAKMKITQTQIRHHQLQFKFNAGTSRGTITDKDTWYLQLFSASELIGIGEAGPLKGLSIDPIDQVADELEKVGKLLVGRELPRSVDAVYHLAKELSSEGFPSIRFALETALLDAFFGGKKKIFDTKFIRTEEKIPINGLIWMGDEAFMQKQIQEKIDIGFRCIKMKIGAINFDTEIKLLQSIRSRFSADQITLRVDANGAFSLDDAFEKLKVLSAFDIHSIEQPIQAGQIPEMRELCRNTPLPIALDEELIGINSFAEKVNLLQTIQPQYIILKPSLIGGIQSTLEWIQIAKENKIDWWLTSMLESNIGLNAICQLASFLNVTMPQGLGTGQLYHNNINSPLTIANGEIYYKQASSWDLDSIT